MSKERIKLLIADDTVIARDGLKNILETSDEIEIVGDASRAIEAIQKARDLQPDVILIDLKWFGDETAGWSAISEIKSQLPQIKVIALTAYENLIRDARLAGADGALLKTFTREELIKTILDIFPQKSDQNQAQLRELLSSRELEIITLLIDGLSDREIAESMSINVNSVKTHIKSILEKFGADNRTEAARFAINKGLAQSRK